VQLLEGACEIWVARISEFSEHHAALDDLLTPDERAHVQRIREGRATAALSRVLLRLVLARYLAIPPAEIEIDRSCPDCGRPHGRPRLRKRPEMSADVIEFSVSHGGDVLVLAFTAGNAPVGVDVEPFGALEGVGVELLDFTLTAAERRRLLEVPEPERRRVFLRHWTAKEAALKALGAGLAVEPQVVALPSWPIAGKVSVTLPGSPTVDLWISDVEVGPAHVCTLATGEHVRKLRLARLSPSDFPAGTQARAPVILPNRVFGLKHGQVGFGRAGAPVGGEHDA
jgi:4'-phosphopantetheinyl transferase